MHKIARTFFERAWRLESPSADCLLFDTTNYYTYMAGHTESELAMRCGYSLGTLDLPPGQYMESKPIARSELANIIRDYTEDRGPIIY